MAVVAAPTDGAPGTEVGLWLGDESWAKDPAAMAAQGITHRLQCNMREEDAQRWMAEQWCDCPGCPGGARAWSWGESRAVAASGQAQPAAGEATAPDDTLDVPPPPVQHPVPRPQTHGLDIEVATAGEDGSHGVVNGYLPLFDDEPFARDHAGPLLRAGAQFIHKALDVEGGRVYVHCEKGCSRSPSVVTQYLMEFRGMPLVQAAALLKDRRCRASLNGGFVDALARNAQELGRGAAPGGETAGSEDAVKALSAEVLAVFRRPWLADYRAGRVKLEPVSHIV